MSRAAPQPAAVGKWIVAGTVLFGTFMAVMDVTVVNVALPHMMGSFGVDRSTITWVATGYAIAQVIMLTMAGWWSTLLGRKRLYLISFGVFTAGSILAGTASTFGQMIFYRIIQGMGGGALAPVSLAILRESFPRRQQGMAMAIYGMGVVLAPAFGPVLGGWLIDHYGWPWIFYINVPVSVLGMLLVTTFVQDPPYLRRGVTKTDWPGIALLAVGLTVLQIVLEKGNQYDWLRSTWIVAGIVVALVSLALLAVRELRVEEPVVRLRLLRNVPLAACSAIGLVFGVALFGTTFILPQYTQSLLGYTAFKSGMVLMPRALAVLVMMPVAGLLFRYVDGRLLVFGGIVLLCVGYWQLAHLTLYVAPWNLVHTLIVMGAGMPFMFVTLTAISLSGIDKADMTDASSIYTLARTVGGNIGYALTATLVANGTQAHRAFLVQGISALNPAYSVLQQRAVAGLMGRGLDAASAGQTAHAIFNSMVNRNAAMLAYNDAAMLMGLMFVVTLPMILLLPATHARGHQQGAIAEA